VVVLVAEQYGPALAPAAPALLQALSGAVMDPLSPAARRLMATAAAHVAALAPTASVERLLVHQRSVYLTTAPDGTARLPHTTDVGNPKPKTTRFLVSLRRTAWGAGLGV
jgi:hypothetical protein